MNKYHKEILDQIKKGAVENKDGAWVSKYLGTNSHYYSLPVPKKRVMARAWAREHKDISLGGFLDFLSSLYEGKSYEEKTFASLLLEYHPKLRNQIDPQLLGGWLERLSGWAEIDSLCQSNFTYQDLATNWSAWSKLLPRLAKDKNISKRRASLVLLTKPVGHSDDPGLAKLAFENIDRLKVEKDILITKAISWLLRSLITRHRALVKSYLEENIDCLPKIAIRETTKKLETGKK